MYEAESNNFKLSIMGGDKNPRKRGDFSNLNYEKLCRWIAHMEISEEVKKECILLLKKYPHSALTSFVRNFQNVHLRLAQANARKKLRENMETETVQLGESGYVSMREKENVENEQKNADFEAENEKLPDLPKEENQTDFFPEAK